MISAILGLLALILIGRLREKLFDLLVVLLIAKDFFHNFTLIPIGNIWLSEVFFLNHFAALISAVVLRLRGSGHIHDFLPVRLSIGGAKRFPLAYYVTARWQSWFSHEFRKKHRLIIVCLIVLVRHWLRKDVL